MKKLACCLTIIVFAIAGCKKSDPSAAAAKAAFDTGKFNYYASEAISFNNNSQNAGSYHWDFGDGTSSNETIPAHSYNIAGKYTITLTVNGASTAKSTVKIFPGTASYVIHNSSSSTLPFLSFGTDILNNTGTGVSNGTLGTNTESDTVFTYHSYVFVEGIIGGRYFYVTNPYFLTYNQHNILYYYNNTGITYF